MKSGIQIHPFAFRLHPFLSCGRGILSSILSRMGLLRRTRNGVRSHDGNGTTSERKRTQPEAENAEGRTLPLSHRERFFAEPALEPPERFFASLRMTAGERLRMTESEGLRMTVSEGLRMTRTKGLNTERRSVRSQESRIGIRSHKHCYGRRSCSFVVKEPVLVVSRQR
jgi:hypothetical protein